MNRLIILIVGLCLSGYSLGGDIQDRWSSLDNKSFRELIASSKICAGYSFALNDDARSTRYYKEQSYYSTFTTATIAFKACEFSVEKAKAYGCHLTKHSMKENYVYTREFSLEDCNVDKLNQIEVNKCFAMSKTYSDKFVAPLAMLKLDSLRQEGDFGSSAKYLDYIAGKYVQSCGYEG